MAEGTKWIRKFDGGLYESDDGRVRIILTNGTGTKGNSVNGKRYLIRIDGRPSGSAGTVRDAKALAIERMTQS